MDQSSKDSSKPQPDPRAGSLTVQELPGIIPGPKPNTTSKLPPWRPIYLQNCSGETSSESEVDDAGNDSSDPFLGSGRATHTMDIGIDTEVDTTLSSPTTALRRNDHKGGSTAGGPAAVNPQGSKDEVFALLDELTRTYESVKKNNEEVMYQSGCASAMREIQKELMRRSDLLYVSNAEGRILRREAANLDLPRDLARSESRRAQARNIWVAHPSLIKGKLSAALAALFDEAQAARRTLEEVTGHKAGSDPARGGGGSGNNAVPDSAAQTARNPPWVDHHLSNLTTERRALLSKIEELEKERQQHRGDISRLQKRVDDLLAARSAQNTVKKDIPNVPVPVVSSPAVPQQPIKRKTDDTQGAA